MRRKRSGGGFALKAAIGGLAFAAIAGAVWVGNRAPEEQHVTFSVVRGPLDIKVVEGGNVEALESQEIKSQVKGWQGTKILYIVEEGYYVTEEDVKNKLKLVELDSSELQDKLTTSQIQFKGTQASLTEAEKGYDIQINQSESDIYGAELEVQFAEMEMKKYLGHQVTALVMEALEKIEEEDSQEPDSPKGDAAAAESVASAPIAEESIVAEVSLDPKAAPSGAASDHLETSPPVASPVAPAEDDFIEDVSLEDLRIHHPDIDFSGFARDDMLGNGEASQKLRKLEDDLMLAEGDKTQADSDYEGKRRLWENDFITDTELKNAEIKRDKQKASVEAAETAKALFIEYEFPKQAQKLLADYVQAKRKLDRTEQQALSKLAQAKAQLLSAQARHKIEAERIKEYQDQIAKCLMVAERPGLVVYGGSGPRYWDAEPIKEGATVREKQAIITIPDTSTMAVKVNIHEAEIKKVTVGQKARVRVDAFADRELSGEVIKVGVLPDTENRWMNPDLKVYETTVKINGTHDWLKPGMSAEVEVFVKHLDQATYIPIQSVVPQGDKQVCFVIEDGTPVPREITTGDLTVEFITVTDGLQPGEQVLIRPPEGSRKEDTDKDNATDEGQPETETPKPAPAGAGPAGAPPNAG